MSFLKLLSGLVGLFKNLAGLLRDRRLMKAGEDRYVHEQPGCLIGTTATVSDSGCIIFNPIFYSSQDDTPETIAAVRSHNAAWHATCGDSE